MKMIKSKQWTNKMGKLFVGLVAFSMTFIAGCEKENQLGNESTSTSAIEESCEFASRVKIYDESHTYFVSYEVRSNDENSFRQILDLLESSTLELHKDFPVINGNEVSRTDKQELELTERKAPATILEEVERSIGTYKGYRLKMGMNTSENMQKTPTYVSIWGAIYVQAPSVTALWIQNASPTTLNVDKYYYDGSTWVWTSVQTITYTQYAYNTAGGVSHKRCLVTPQIYGPTVFWWDVY